MNIILHTIHCPQCKVLQKKLDKSNISYQINENMDEIIARGFQSAPILQVDDDFLDFNQAREWLKENYS